MSLFGFQVFHGQVKPLRRCWPTWESNGWCLATASAARIVARPARSWLGDGRGGFFFFRIFFLSVFSGWLMDGWFILKPSINHPSTIHQPYINQEHWWMVDVGCGFGGSYQQEQGTGLYGLFGSDFFFSENHRESWDSAVACQTKPLWFNEYSIYI